MLFLLRQLGTDMRIRIVWELDSQPLHSPPVMWSVQLSRGLKLMPLLQSTSSAERVRGSLEHCE